MAISGRQFRFRRGFPVIGPGPARFPRRFAPRNDKLESFTPQNAYRRYCQPAWRSMSAATDAIGWCVFIGGRCGLQVPPRDCTPRALPRASRSGRHVGLRPPRNDNSGAFAILTVACTDCKCIAGLGCPLPCNAQLVALRHKINPAKKPAQPEVSEGRKV